MKVIENNYISPVRVKIDNRLGKKKCPYCGSIVEVEYNDIKRTAGYPILGPSYEDH